MKPVIVAVFTSLISITTLAQISDKDTTNWISIGDKSYRSTGLFHFGARPHNTKMMIGNHGGGTGVIYFSCWSNNGPRLTGDLLIYLDDGSVIICKDNGKNDMVDNRSIKCYILSTAQVNSMLNSNIRSYRFSVYNPADGMTTNHQKTNFMEGIEALGPYDIPKQMKWIFN